MTPISSANLSKLQISRVSVSNLTKILMTLHPRNLTEQLKNCENYRYLRRSRRTLERWILKIDKSNKLKEKSSQLNTFCLEGEERTHAGWSSPNLCRMTLQSPATLIEAIFPTMWFKSCRGQEIYTRKTSCDPSSTSPPSGINKELSS